MDPRKFVGLKVRVVVRSTNYISRGTVGPETDERFLQITDDRDGKTRLFNIESLESIQEADA